MLTSSRSSVNWWWLAYLMNISAICSIKQIQTIEKMHLTNKHMQRWKYWLSQVLLAAKSLNTLDLELSLALASRSASRCCCTSRGWRALCSWSVSGSWALSSMNVGFTAPNQVLYLARAITYQIPPISFEPALNLLGPWRNTLYPIR